MKLYTVKLEDILYIYDEGSKEEAEKQIDAHMKRTGASRTNPDGSITWYSDEMNVDTTKSGSAAFTWRGDKVLYTRFLMTVKNGVLAKKQVKRLYKNFD